MLSNTATGMIYLVCVKWWIAMLVYVGFVMECMHHLYVVHVFLSFIFRSDHRSNLRRILRCLVPLEIYRGRLPKIELLQVYNND